MDVNVSPWTGPNGVCLDRLSMDLYVGPWSQRGLRATKSVKHVSHVHRPERIHNGQLFVKWARRCHERSVKTV